MNHYKTIDGHQYDSRLIKLAEEAVKGAGDGRISIHDAEKLLQVVKDGSIFTSVEKETIKYLHQKFHWTDSAFLWFNNQLWLWYAEFEKPLKMSCEELSKQHFFRV
jgi:hypothetical protein